jgi:hypothetical protein
MKRLVTKASGDHFLHLFKFHLCFLSHQDFEFRLLTLKAWEIDREQK